jgi:hypothetical protein
MVILENIMFGVKCLSCAEHSSLFHNGAIYSKISFTGIVAGKNALMLTSWSHNTQHNDTQHNVTQHNDTQNNYTRHKYIQHNDI